MSIQKFFTSIGTFTVSPVMTGIANVATLVNTGLNIATLVQVGETKKSINSVASTCNSINRNTGYILSDIADMRDESRINRAYFTQNPNVLGVSGGKAQIYNMSHMLTQPIQQPAQQPVPQAQVAPEPPQPQTAQPAPQVQNVNITQPTEYVTKHDLSQMLQNMQNNFNTSVSQMWEKLPDLVTDVIGNINAKADEVASEVIDVETPPTPPTEEKGGKKK